MKTDSSDRLKDCKSANCRDGWLRGFSITYALTMSLLFCYPILAQAEPVPDDIRYYLEDLYGADTKNWPDKIYTQDVNADQLADWIATKSSCDNTEACPVEVFICVPDKKGGCKEYCYIEVTSMSKLKQDLSVIPCKATC